MLKKIIALTLAVVLLIVPLTACGGYTDKTYKNNVSCFGWEGDKNAPWIYMDGSYKITDRDIDIHFGVKNISGTISWQFDKGYLPSFRSEYVKKNVEYSLITFADKVVYGGKNYVAAYTSFSIVNNSKRKIKFPDVSKELVPLSAVPESIGVNQRINVTYAIFVDKFGAKYDYPSDKVLKNLGSFAAHYTHMQNYWIERVKGIVNIESLPYDDLINAYKAGYIFTLIVKDGDELHVGENNYDRVFDHDTIDILSTLVELGDTTNFEKYASHILDNVQYKDARWKYCLPYAFYLQKTGDLKLLERNFNNLKSNTHYIEKERNSQGIMMKTDAIDAGGYWTVDDWSALAGLSAYKYICENLYKRTSQADYKTESEWADKLYKVLFKCVEKVMGKTISDNKLNYIPVSVTEPNTANRCKDANDANWASMFLFGSWAWQGYLFGAKQQGKMLSLIDDTYAYGFARLKNNNYPSDTFGGFTGVCSAYNAGYGSAALRGEKYRDTGIKAYIYQLENTESAPYSWWENAESFGDDGKYNGTSYVNSGWGSCPHMWGQAQASKVLLDSLICEKSDGTLIICRGIPKSWISDEKKIKVSNYLTSSGKVGFSITTEGKKVRITISGKHNAVKLEPMKFKDSIKSVEGGSFDNESGIVSIASDTQKVIVNLK